MKSLAVAVTLLVVLVSGVAPQFNRFRGKPAMRQTTEAALTNDVGPNSDPGFVSAIMPQYSEALTEFERFLKVEVFKFLKFAHENVFRHLNGTDIKQSGEIGPVEWALRVRFVDKRGR